MYDPNSKSISSFKPFRSQFLQITGEDGSGTRRLCFSFLEAKAKAVWISPEWKIYAPALWKLAQEKEVFLMGVEIPQPLSHRQLFYELHEANVFDFWILDHLRLKASEGFFLHKLLSSSSTQVIILDNHPHSFCQKRLKVFLSHDQYRLQWTKGGPLSPQYIPALPLLEMQRDICSLSD